MSDFLERDIIQGFMFEDKAIRGAIVRLHGSYQAVLSRHPYPPFAQQLLGEALCVVALLSHTVKMKGSILLQAQGNGPVNLLLAECDNAYHMRGLVTHQNPLMPGHLSEIFGMGGKMAITLKPQDQPQQYQGIVPLVGETLAQAVELYFMQSEQIPTKIYLAHDAMGAAGFLLQTLPSELSPMVSQDWQHVVTLSDTLRPQELLGLSNRDILHRLYHQEVIRLFEGQPVSFRCSCSRVRMESVLIGLGEAELLDIIKEQGVIDTYCEFCNHHYTFDAVDVRQLLADPIAHTYSTKEH